MERSCGARTIDGSYFDSDRRRNVPTGHCCIQLTVAYKGTHYFGWQKTKFGPSIQQELETAWVRLSQPPVSMDAISRTDRGVHAKGQIVQFCAPPRIPIDRLPQALNAHLPKDIRVIQAHYAPSFLTPISKTYCYTLHLGPYQSPFLREESWHYPYPIQLDRMKEGAAYLIGSHDFSSFSTEPQENSTRTLYSIEITSNNLLLEIRMTGDKFLYKMARTIAGTLANLGSDKLSKETFTTLLQGRSRSLAGVTAPPQGLCLEKINAL